MDKKLNSAKISLTYLNDYKIDIDKKIKKLERDKELLIFKCNGNEELLDKLTQEETKITEEIKKGEELQKLLKTNCKILDKLYSL